MAGELESELRRALQHLQKSADQGEGKNPAWDPIVKARELRHEPGAIVPVSATAQTAPAKTRGSGIGRSLVAISISAAVAGFAVNYAGQQWRGGGGGGGGAGGERRESTGANVAAVAKPQKDQSKLVQTGYSIQPLIDPAKPGDLTVTEMDEPSYIVKERDIAGHNASEQAAAKFRQDVEEAASLINQAERAAAAASAAKTAEPAPYPQVASISGAEEARLLQRGHDLLQRGDITGARLLFEHLAVRDSALAAFALAQSYDSDFLKKMQVRGLSPDQKQADRWYRRAAELGTRSR